jgi:hypothetical protein
MGSNENPNLETRRHQKTLSFMDKILFLALFSVALRDLLFLRGSRFGFRAKAK